MAEIKYCLEGWKQACGSSHHGRAVWCHFFACPFCCAVWCCAVLCCVVLCVLCCTRPRGTPAPLQLSRHAGRLLGSMPQGRYPRRSMHIQPGIWCMRIDLSEYYSTHSYRPCTTMHQTESTCRWGMVSRPVPYNSTRQGNWYTMSPPRITRMSH